MTIMFLFLAFCLFVVAAVAFGFIVAKYGTTKGKRGKIGKSGPTGPNGIEGPTGPSASASSIQTENLTLTGGEGITSLSLTTEVSNLITYDYNYTGPNQVLLTGASSIGTLKYITLDNGVTAPVQVNTSQGSFLMFNPNLSRTEMISTTGGLWKQLSGDQSLPWFPTKQQGSVLVPVEAKASDYWGQSVSISADGNTIAIGGLPSAVDSTGGTFIYTRSNGIWTEQARLIGSDSSEPSQQGISVSLSVDGNTVAFGGTTDNGGIGAVWVFVRSNGTWTQQGLKLVGSGSSGSSNQGSSVSLSADGNTLAVGGVGDGTLGATWIFVRSNGSWSQQGAKLVGSGATTSSQGASVSLSADGNTVAIGGPTDNDGGLVGATWIFVRSNLTWTQFGSKLVGSGAIGSARQGTSVSLSADGKTLAMGGYSDDSFIGATWIFKSISGTWTQMGEKLVGYGYVGQSYQGNSVSLNADGTTLAVGGPNDGLSFTGATWIFCNINDVWYQMGEKLTGTGLTSDDYFGYSVDLDASGDTLVVGAPYGTVTNQGKTFVFV